MSLKYEVHYILGDPDLIVLCEYQKCMVYCRHGDEHRLPGPAKIWEDTSMIWYYYGQEAFWSIM